MQTVYIKRLFGFIRLFGYSWQIDIEVPKDE